MKPLYDRIIIKLIEQDISSSIIIPDELKDKPNIGKVIAVGCGKLLPNGKIIKLQVKVDDIVYFNKYSGIPYQENHLILKEEEVLGII